ncbi:MAG: segregation/condensation protein A [Propionibacteriaceae bacterium]|nr:segregation/condensation protein A [Propionibacteriaceae bacterium]
MTRRGRTRTEERPETTPGFDVHLTNFEGPFDLLLQLISRRELDVTQVALSQVTDEFIAYVRAAGDALGLEQTSSFLVVAATLLDLKAARLLPGGEITDPEDLAALEARDLLFARLLQYRAFKQLAAWVAEAITVADRQHWRPGGLEEQFREVLPEVELPINADELARLAARALTPKPKPVVQLAHLHGSQVSVVEQTSLVAERLSREGQATFRALVAGCDRLTTVVRFLAVLELFRAGQVSFEQASPLAELSIRWSGGQVRELDVDEYGFQED